MATPVRLQPPWRPQSPSPASWYLATSTTWCKLQFRCAAGYVSFLFFLSKKWWVPLVKAVLRCALWLAGATQKLPLRRVRPPHLLEGRL